MRGHLKPSRRNKSLPKQSTKPQQLTLQRSLSTTNTNKLIQLTSQSTLTDTQQQQQSTTRSTQLISPTTTLTTLIQTPKSTFTTHSKSNNNNKHSKPKQYDQSSRPTKGGRKLEQQQQPQQQHEEGEYNHLIPDDQNAFFFDQNAPNIAKDYQRTKSDERRVGLETVKGFLGSDPSQYGLDRKSQQQIAMQLLDQLQEQAQFQDDDENGTVTKKKTPDEEFQDQLRQLERLPTHKYLSETTNIHDSKHFLESLSQQDKAQHRFNQKLNLLNQNDSNLNLSQIDFSQYDNLNELDDGDNGSNIDLKAFLNKFKPQVGEHGELIFDETQFASSQLNQQQQDQDGINNDNLQESFDQYHSALADDPTVFKYYDDDYEYFIPPGMSIQKLTKMDLPVQEILNYVRKQIVEGQLQTNYMGVNLQQLSKQIHLDNLQREKTGQELITLQDYKPTTFDSLDLTGLPEQDIADLKQYYSHFEQFRRLKQFEKMKDNPAYDPDDPDWNEDNNNNDDNENEPKISKRQLKKIKKLEIQMDLQQPLKKQTNINDDESISKLTHEQKKSLLERFGTHNTIDLDLTNHDLIDQTFQQTFDENQAKRLELLQNGDAFERALQFPDHKPTIKALQTFVRTVPMDEPIPRELQRRLNLLLNDADYAKRKDYHYMMNDVEIWYLANRLPVVYSIIRRVLIEIRQRIPTWKPERVLEFAAGASPALWAVRDIYYQDIGEYTAVERDGRLALLGQQLTADLGIHIYYRSRLLVNDNGQMEISKDDELKREQKRKKLTHKQRKLMDKEDKQRKEKQLLEMSKKHTLVLAPYALSKQPNKEYRRLLLEALWDQVDPNGGLLILIESTEADSSGFNVIRECRDYLLRKYPKVQVENDSTKKLNDDEIISPLIQVEDKINNIDGDNTVEPAWAKGATKKVTTEEQKLRQKKPAQPSASSILPCSHDKPCPMGAMLKLNEEVKKLKSLAKEEQLSISLPQVPIKSCMFGQRMLRAPMPNQSPLQDLDIPQFLGDAIIENFSYIVLRRGDIPTVKDDDLEVKPYESNFVPKGKVNLPGGLTREEYLELKAYEKQQEYEQSLQKEQEQNNINDIIDSDDEKQAILNNNDEFADFIDDDIDGNLEYDVLMSNVNDDIEQNNLNDIEARRLAKNIFGAKSIDNEEVLEQYTEAMIHKLPNAMKPQQQHDDEDGDNNTATTSKIKTTTTSPQQFKHYQTKDKNKYQLANELALEMDNNDDMIKQQHELPQNDNEPQRDILEDYDLDIIQQELGYELDEEALQTLREVILESEKERPLMNPKREFNLNRWSRVLSPPLKRGGHVVLDLCTPDGNFERRIVGREGVGSAGYKQARVMNWGDIWPYKRPMTLRELKEQRQADKNAKSSQFQHVSTSTEAKETLRELRELFSVAYTPESIKNLQHLNSKLDTATAQQHEQNIQIDTEELNFDNLDNIHFTSKQSEQLQLAYQLRLQHEERYKQSQRNKLKDNTPDVFHEMNIFNDPSFYEAIPGFDKYGDGPIPEGTPGTTVINGKVVITSDFRQESFEKELQAQKLLQDLRSLPKEQQELLGPDVQAALQKLGGSIQQNNKDNDYLSQLNVEAQTPIKSTSLLEQLRQDAIDKRKLAQSNANKEFLDDMSDDNENNNNQGDNDTTKSRILPTTLSHGIKVDDIISNVEQRIQAIQTQKKERNKLNKKQQKIAEKQLQKELLAVSNNGTLTPQEQLQVQSKLNELEQNNNKKGSNDKVDPASIFTTGSSSMHDDFMKLMSQNVEYDESIASYEQIRQQQDNELQQLQQDKKVSKLDDIDQDDDVDDNDDDGSDMSYDEENDGPSDYDDGEIIYKPKHNELNDNDDQTLNQPIDLSLASKIDLTKLKTNQWSVTNSNEDRQALRSKLLDILAQPQTDELKQFLDNPILQTSSTRKAKQLHKDEKKKAASDETKIKDKSKLTRVERQKLDQMRSEYLFSDDDEWDLNENDHISKTNAQKQQQNGDNTTTKKSKSDEVHTIHGAALDVVDHSYRILPTNLKNKLGVPLTGKRSFAENIELLEKQHEEEDGGDINDNTYVDVTARNGQRPQKKNIHGYRKEGNNNSYAKTNNAPNKRFGNGNNGNRNNNNNSRRGYSTINNNNTNIFHITKPQLSSSLPPHQQRTAPLLTMPGAAPPKNTKVTKAIQIGQGLQHQKLHPNQKVYLNALGINQQRPTGQGSHHSSYYNSILTPIPTHDLAENERTIPLSESSLTALSKDNKQQAKNVGVHGFFRYDGGLPLGQFSIVKSQEMAIKLQELAGIRDPSSSSTTDNNNTPPHQSTIPTPGVKSPFKDFSAPPMNMNHSETALNPMDTRNVFGHDIYVHEEDQLEKRINKKHDEVPGVLYRTRQPKSESYINHHASYDPQGDEFETYGNDIYLASMDRNQTKYDDFGNELKGKLGTQGAEQSTIDHFRDQESQRRKLESRKKRAEFGQRIDNARRVVSKLGGKAYTPLNTHDSTGHNKRSEQQPNNHNLYQDQIDSSQQKHLYQQRINSIQDEIDKVKQLRRERQRKMLTPLALSDELPRDPEGNLLASLKIKPDVFAKTSTEKRQSLAIIEQEDEAELRHLREKQGLDYSYTALMTNIDGFGPKMDPSGRYIDKTTLTPFENDTITLEELENLVSYASDDMKPTLQQTMKSAHDMLQNDTTIQQQYKDFITNGSIRTVPFKLQLIPKKTDNETTLMLGSNQNKKLQKQTFDYNIRPLSSQELTLLQTEQNSILSTQPDVRKDVEQLLLKHQKGLTFKQKQDILAEDHDQQIKLSLATSQLGNLARRFTQLAQEQEDRDLLRGDSDQEYVFEPPTIPTLQTAWGVKNRAPERHVESTAATDHFVRQQRKYDKLIAEMQEVELLEKLTGNSIKIPDSIQNTNTSPYQELQDEQAKELLIKKGIKTRAQIELEDLQDALSFERGMHEAIDENYGHAKELLKYKLQKMAKNDGIGPKQFQQHVQQGLLSPQLNKDKKGGIAGSNNNDLKLLLQNDDNNEQQYKKPTKMEIHTQKLLQRVMNPQIGNNDNNNNTTNNNNRNFGDIEAAFLNGDNDLHDIPQQRFADAEIIHNNKNNKSNNKQRHGNNKNQQQTHKTRKM